MKNTNFIALHMLFILSTIGCSTKALQKNGKGQKFTSSFKKFFKNNHIQDSIFSIGIVGGSVNYYLSPGNQKNPITQNYINLSTNEPTNEIRTKLDELGGYYINHNEIRHTHDALFKYLPDGTLDPCLVNFYSYNHDFTEWEFKLKKGVYFHKHKVYRNRFLYIENIFSDDVDFEITPQELKADDVVYSLMRIIDNPKCKSYSMIGGIVEKVEKKDDYTVTMKLPKSYAKLPEVLSRRPLGISNKFADESGYHRIGTGPFVFVSNVNNKIIYKKNEKYHQRLVNDEIDGLVVHGSHPGRNIYSDFKNGKLDFISNIPDNEYEKFSQDEEISLDHINQGRTVFMYFNHRNEILKDKEVRRAISLIINREVLIEKLGYDKLANSFIPEGLENSDSVNKNPILEYNPQKAKKIINHKNLKNQTIVFRCPFITEGAKEYLIKQFGEICCKLEFGTFDRKSPDMQIGIGWWGSCSSDPSDMFILLANGNENTFNSPGYNNPKYNKYFEALNNSIGEEKRIENIKKLDSILNDDIAIIPLCYREGKMHARNNRIRVPKNTMPYSHYVIPHHINFNK